MRMNASSLRLILLFCFLLPVACAADDSLNVSPFGKILIYKPATGAPTSEVILISGDGGFEYRVTKMAQAAADEGALVAGIDITTYLGKEKQRDWRGCPAEDLVKLNATVRKAEGLNLKSRPVLVGYSSGATIAYAALAEAPSSFAGAITLGFCPELEGVKVCAGDQLKWRHGGRTNVIILEPSAKLAARWITLQGDMDEACDSQRIAAFVAKAPGAEMVRLKGVGHGFNIPDNWIAAFDAAFQKMQK